MELPQTSHLLLELLELLLELALLELPEILEVIENMLPQLEHLYILSALSACSGVLLLSLAIKSATSSRRISVSRLIMPKTRCGYHSRTNIANDWRLDTRQMRCYSI